MDDEQSSTYSDKNLPLTCASHRFAMAVALAAVIALVSVLPVAAREWRAAQTTLPVSIRGLDFIPQSLTIAPGDTVEWTHNDGDIGHNVSLPGTFRSPGMYEGGSFRFTFTEPGTYSYGCSLHPSIMVGTVVVAASAPAPTPPPSPSTPALSVVTPAAASPTPLPVGSLPVVDIVANSESSAVAETSPTVASGSVDVKSPASGPMLATADPVEMQTTQDGPTQTRSQGSAVGAPVITLTAFGLAMVVFAVLASFTLRRR